MKVTVKKALDKILKNINGDTHTSRYLVGNIKYVRGFFTTQAASAGNDLQKIQYFISNLNTENKVVVFDVVLKQSGLFRFTGYIYAGKEYGGGVFMTWTAIRYWYRNNGTDTFKTINLT